MKKAGNDTELEKARTETKAANKSEKACEECEVVEVQLHDDSGNWYPICINCTLGTFNGIMGDWLFRL